MKHPDLTPSLIADRLCPEAAGPIIRQIIEAAAEKAIEITPRHQGATLLMQASLVERNVCLAARIALQRQSERIENLLLALQDDDTSDRVVVDVEVEDGPTV